MAREALRRIKAFSKSCPRAGDGYNFQVSVPHSTSPFSLRNYKSFRESEGRKLFREIPVTPEEVRAEIDARLGGRRYRCTDDPKNRRDEMWLREVDGAGILRDIFGALSENRARYDKVKHSTDLTRWILENSPGDLREVADLLAGVLSSKGKPGG
jgi:hypothetical protein